MMTPQSWRFWPSESTSVLMRMSICSPRRHVLAAGDRGELGEDVAALVGMVAAVDAADVRVARRFEPRCADPSVSRGAGSGPCP